MTGTDICQKCGKDHERRCTAHKKSGVACRRWPPKGSRVCVMHGYNGATAAKVERVAQHDAAVEAAHRFALRTDVDPTTALLDLVQYQAGIVAYWRGRVETVTEADLTWGVVKKVEKDGLVPMDETHEAAGPNVVYTMLTDAQDKLALYASAALRAGVEERRVRVAEQQGELFAAAQRNILTHMFNAMVESLRQNGIGERAIIDSLTFAWAEATSVVVPQELRALAQTPA